MKKFIGISFLLVLAVLGLGCTVLNFGVGAAISPPQKDVQKEQFKPESFHSIYPIKFTTKVYSNSSVKEVGMSNGFFVKEKGSDNLLHMDQNDVVVHRQNNGELNGYITHLGKSPEGIFLRFRDEQKVSIYEIDTLKFYTKERDPEYNYVTEHIGLVTDSTRQTLRNSEMENFYLGFDVYRSDVEPYFVEVKQVDKVVYRTGMGPLPYFLGGIGLLTDIIVGTLIFLL